MLVFEKINDLAVFPKKGTEGSAGFDLFCLGSGVIGPGCTKRIETGIRVQFPLGHFGLIKERSSVSISGVCTLAGVIDNDYRGELIIVVHNGGNEAYGYTHLQRLAQLIVLPYYTGSVDHGGPVDSTARGSSGFGSTNVGS